MTRSVPTFARLLYFCFLDSCVTDIPATAAGSGRAMQREKNPVSLKQLLQALHGLHGAVALSHHGNSRRPLPKECPLAELMGSW